MTVEEVKPGQASFAKFLLLPKGKNAPFTQSFGFRPNKLISQNSDYKSTPTYCRQRSKYGIRHKRLSSGFQERLLYFERRSKCTANVPKYFTAETPSSSTLPTTESTSTSAD